MSVPLKTESQIEALRHSAGVLSDALDMAALAAIAGTAVRDLDARIAAHLRSHGAEPVLIGRAGGSAPRYGFSSCISVNEQALHAPPGERVLHAGDLVSIDAAARVGDWCADAAVSVAVGGGPRAGRLIDTVRACLRAAFAELRPGAAWASVAGAVQAAASAHGVTCTTALTGTASVANFTNRRAAG